MYVSKSKKRKQYSEDTIASSLLKLMSLNKVKDFMVSATIYCPKKNPIRHKTLYDIVSSGDNDIYFHLIKCDKKTKTAMHDIYINVAGALKYPPARIVLGST